jgi:AcrR family transcriptional regulator
VTRQPGRRSAASTRARVRPRARGGRERDDPDTRQRLLDVARTLFTEQGFRPVTVRDICRAAHANVAAVNYYFGGKEGLYLEIVHEGIAVMRETQEIAVRAGDSLPPPRRLRAYVRAFLGRVMQAGGPSWIHKLVTRELNDPSPALELIAQQAIQPRIAYLQDLLAELLDCDKDDERVANCLSSIWGQWLIQIPNEGRDRLWPQRRTPADIERIVDHITEFSLGGIRAIAAKRGH